MIYVEEKAVGTLDTFYQWWMEVRHAIDRHLPEERLDRCLLGIAAIAFMGASATLIAVLGFQPYGHQAQIGQVTSPLKVHRREARSLDWQEIGPGSPIYLRDTIRTQKSESAVIRFGNGKELSVEGASIVQIEEIFPRRVEVSIYRGGVKKSDAVTVRGHDPLKIVPPPERPILAFPQIIDPR